MVSAEENPPHATFALNGHEVLIISIESIKKAAFAIITGKLKDVQREASSVSSSVPTTPSMSQISVLVPGISSVEDKQVSHQNHCIIFSRKRCERDLPKNGRILDHQPLTTTR